jgi:hypothetical protein
MRFSFKKFSLAAAVALAVIGSAGAAQAQHWHGGGGHWHGGGWHGGGGWGPGFVGGLALGAAYGGYYGGPYYGYGGCYRRVFIDRWGYRRYTRVCY